MRASCECLGLMLLPDVVGWRLAGGVVMGDRRMSVADSMLSPDGANGVLSGCVVAGDQVANVTLVGLSPRILHPWVGWQLSYGSRLPCGCRCDLLC